MYRTCRHCGQRVHRVVCYEFGTSDFCEPCATKLGLSQLVEEYEEAYYPIGKPSLVDTIKLRLYEMGITQSKLAEMLDISPARVSEIMTGKCEPTLKIGRAISRKLNISPSIVLGV